MSLSLSDIIPPLDYYTPRLIFLKSNIESGACVGGKKGNLKCYTYLKVKIFFLSFNWLK